MDFKGSAYDETDEIVFSGTFNVFGTGLTLKLYDLTFKFIFEASEPLNDQKDIVITSETDKVGLITFSNKIRNALGSGSNEKLQVVNLNDGRILLFTVFAQSFGEKLNVTITFYARQQ